MSIEAKAYWLDGEDDLWAKIYCNGRYTWYAVVGCDSTDPLYKAVQVLDVNHKDMEDIILPLINERLENNRFHYEEDIMSLPHIEDASKPMREAWKASLGAMPFGGAGERKPEDMSEKEYIEENGISEEEYIRQMEEDIEKYHLDETCIMEKFNEDYIYSVTCWLSEYFTDPVEEAEETEKSEALEEYTEELKELAKDDDVEVAHSRADNIVINVLKILGHTELAEAYKNVPKRCA